MIWALWLDLSQFFHCVWRGGGLWDEQQQRLLWGLGMGSQRPTLRGAGPCSAGTPGLHSLNSITVR